MSTKADKVQYAILHNPNLIPTILNDTSINKGLIYRKLKKALPCRIGIEFELAGNYAVMFVKKYNKTYNSWTDLQNIMIKHYNVTAIKCDEPKQLYSGDVPLEEVRISISDFKQLKGLYKFLQDMPEFCKLHEGGGIHIHVDMSMYNYYNTSKESEVVKYIKNRLTEVGKIFPAYKGKYNKRKVGSREKATWVNLSRLNTLEFRIAPLTFDYYTIMTWVIKLIKFRQELIHCCKLAKKHSNKASADGRIYEWRSLSDDRIDYYVTSIDRATDGTARGEPDTTISTTNGTTIRDVSYGNTTSTQTLPLHSVLN